MKSISKKIFKPLSGGFIHLLYPPVCPLCDSTLPMGESGRLCDECRKKIVPISEPACFRCGRQLTDASAEYCRQCEKRSFRFKRGFSVFNYEGEAKELILKLKYKGRKDIARFFANEAFDIYGSRLLEYGFDAVIPVPIHKKRLVKRGYNQAQAIAEALAEKLNTECLEDMLVRNRQTEVQKSLSAGERFLNLMNAFSVNRDLAQIYACKLEKEKRTLKRVLLVDDIYTTGSTLECCTLALLDAGIREVYFLCAASTNYQG